MHDETAAGCDNSFLPDFCGIRMVFAVVVIAQLLAIVLVLAALGRSVYRWADLGLVSLYAQWTALSGAAVLCLMRRWLGGLGDVAAASLAYLALLATTGLVAALSVAAAGPLGLDPFLPRGWAEGFVVRSLLIGAIVAAVSLRYFYVRHQYQRQVRAESRAHLAALQARIRPHFLFNSLNTAASLTHERPELAESTIEDLAELFRAALAAGARGVTLHSEIDLARRYLNIERLRLGDRLAVDWDVDALDGAALLPPLILQPLLENAVYHGIEPLAEGGRIGVRGTRDGAVQRLVIDNPLPPGAHRAPRDGHRMALDNVGARLAAFFGRDGLLEVTRRDDRYTVELRLPVARGVA